MGEVKACETADGFESKQDTSSDAERQSEADE